MGRSALLHFTTRGGLLPRSQRNRKQVKLSSAMVLLLFLILIVLSEWINYRTGYATAGEPLPFTATLPKNTFTVGEAIRLTYIPEDVVSSLTVLDSEGNAIMVEGNAYVPDRPGEFLFNVLLSLDERSERFALPFSVQSLVNASAAADNASFELQQNASMDNLSEETPILRSASPANASLRPPVSFHAAAAKAPMNFTITDAEGAELETEVELIDPEGNVVYRGEGKRHSQQVERGSYVLRLKPRNPTLPQIEFQEVRIDDGLGMVAEIEPLGHGEGFRNSYAINPMVNFTTAMVTAIAKGNSLYKCKEWDFAARVCNGRWQFQQHLVPGQSYRFTLTPEDPAFGEYASFTLLPMLSELSECTIGTNLTAAQVGQINVSDNSRTTCPDQGQTLRADMLNFTYPFLDVNAYNMNCSVEYINEAGGSNPIGRFELWDKLGGAQSGIGPMASLTMPKDETAPDSTNTSENVTRITYFDINETQTLLLNVTNLDGGGADALFIDYMECRIAFGLEPRWNTTRYFYDNGVLNATAYTGDTVTLNVDRPYNFTVKVRNNRTNVLGNLSTPIYDAFTAQPPTRGPQPNSANFLITAIEDLNGTGVGDLHPDDGGNFGINNVTYLETFQNDNNYSIFTGELSSGCNSEPDDDLTYDSNAKVFIRNQDTDTISNSPTADGNCGYHHMVYNFTALYNRGIRPTAFGIMLFGSVAGVTFPTLLLLNTTKGDWNNVSTNGSTQLAPEFAFYYNESGRNASDYINNSGIMEINFIYFDVPAVGPPTVSFNYPRVYVNISENTSVQWNDPGLFTNASMTHFDAVDEEANFTYRFNANGEVGTYYLYFRGEGGQEDPRSNITIIIVDTVLPNVSKPNASGIRDPAAPRNFIRGEPINLSVNATDNTRLSQVWLQVTVPNGTVLPNITMFNSTAAWNRSINAQTNNFSIQFNDTTQNGTYVVKFAANDTSNNVNDSMSMRFDVHTCGKLQSDLRMTQDVSIGGGCFEMNQSGVDLDCNGRTITFGETAGGVSAVIARYLINLSVQNCYIRQNSTSSSSGLTGVAFQAVNDSLIRNSSVVINGSFSDNTVGIDFTNPSSVDAVGRNNSIVNNTILLDTAGSSLEGISIEVPGNNVTNNTITLSRTSSSYGLRRTNGVTSGIPYNNSIDGNRIIVAASAGSGNIAMASISGGSGSNFTNNWVLSEASETSYLLLLDDAARLNFLANNTLIMNSGLASGGSIIGVRDNALGGSHNNTFVSTTIIGNGTGTSAYGITIHRSHNNSFADTRIQTVGANSTAILIIGSNNTVFNATFMNNTPSWIVVYNFTTQASIGNNFSNTTLFTWNGSILFNESFNISGNANISGYNVNITYNRTFVNATNLTMLNTSAIITLNLTTAALTNPQVVRDMSDSGTFEVCAAANCTEVSFTNNLFVFNITRWAPVYAANETPTGGPDTEIPNVTQPRPEANTLFNQTTKVLVSANVTDNGNLDQIYVNITYPNGTTVNITMRNSTISFNTTSPPDNYTVYFNDTIQFGRYNLSFFANDTANNINNSINTTFNITACECLLDNGGTESSACMVINANCTANFNISVASGGNITLINTTLRMNVSIDGEYGIEVRSGGEMNVRNNSNVTNGDTNEESFTFQVLSGATFSMTDSHVSYSGWQNTTNNFEFERRGLTLSAKPLDLRNNSFAFGNIGVALRANDIAVADNRFAFMNHSAIAAANVSGIDITNNFVRTSAGGFVYIRDTMNHSIIRNNSLLINASPIWNEIGPNQQYITNNLSIIQNNSTVSFGLLSLFHVDLLNLNNSRIIQNSFGQDPAALMNGLVLIRGNYTAIDRNNLTISNITEQLNLDGVRITAGSHDVNITNNIIKNEIGIRLFAGSSNISIVNNTIYYNETGISVDSSNNNITNNTIQTFDPGLQDILLDTGATTNTVWLNHLLSLGINDVDPLNNNLFCINSQGNFYNESIAQNRIQPNNRSCGLANITDTLDGQLVHRQLIVNWSNQSSFQPDVTYSIHAGNGTLLNVTSLANVTINTSTLHDGSQFLRIVPNITFNGIRVNGTNNRSLNFTTDNFPPNCTVVNDFGQDTDGSAFLTYNRTPSFNCTLDGTGNCRMSFTDESFTDMSDNVDCTGDSENTTFCQIAVDRTLGDNTVFIACNNTFGINDSAAENQNFTVTVVPLAGCGLDPNFRGLEFGDQNDNTTNDTIDDRPRPLILVNNGTVMLNLSMNATNLWIEEPNPSDFFTYLIEDNETASYESAQDALPFKQFQSSRWPTVTAVTNLKYVNSTNTNNAVEIEVNVTAPAQEYAGRKTSTIEILCLSNE